MKRLLILILAGLLTIETAVSAKDIFGTHTLLEKKEMSVGASLIYANLGSSNSEYLLMVNNLGADGNFFRFAPKFEYTYNDNAAIGVRLGYSSGKANISSAEVNLLTESLNFKINDASADLIGGSGAIYHRNYFGLEKSGTVGLFAEFQLGYSFTKTGFGENSFNRSNQIKLSFSPGVVLFIIPSVSVEASISIADVSYTGSTSYKDGKVSGNASKIRAAASLNILNCLFGINYHF